MNRFIALFTFTSPQTGITYHEGDEIDQYEYDKLAHSDSKKFAIKQQTVNLGVPAFENPYWY
jgi:hypothetical protein